MAPNRRAVLGGLAIIATPTILLPESADSQAMSTTHESIPNSPVTNPELKLDRTSNEYKLLTFAGAPSDKIPSNVERVFIEDRGAHFAQLSTDEFNSLPDLLRFENESRKFGIDEPLVTNAMAGTVGDGVADDTRSLVAFFEYSANGTLLAKKGIVVRPISGRYRIMNTVTIPFGATLEGPEGTGLYGFQVVLDPKWRGRDVGILIQASTEQFTTAYVAGISLDCSNLPGVQGIRFEGAYFNSTLRNLFIFNLAGDAAGLHVKPLDRLDARKVCESLLLENIYVLRAASASDASVPAILVDRCQESTLVNVKGFGYNQSSNGKSTAAAIKFVDCRGITMIGGAAACGAYGIEIEARTRQASGFALHGITYERLSESRLYIHGTSTDVVSNVRDEGVRIEAPAPKAGLNAEYATFIDVETLYQSVQIGRGVSSAIIRGYGHVVADETARYTQLIAPNANSSAYGIRSSVIISSQNTPQLGFGVDGKTDYWRLLWSTSDNSDNGFWISGPSGHTPLAMGETPETGALRIGFLGKKHVERPTVHGAKNNNTALAALLTALANLGLITDNTT